MNKSTPNSSKLSGGISKNYFTPCKRVGLAPIRKSSSSLSNKSFSDNLIKTSEEFCSPQQNSDKKIEVSDLKECNSTPVSSKENVPELNETKKVNKKSLKKLLNKNDEIHKVEAKINEIDIKNDEPIIENTSSEVNTVNLSSSDKATKKNPIKAVKSKRVKRTLSLKKTLSCDSVSDDDFQENKAKRPKTETRECTIKLNRLTKIDSPKNLPSVSKLEKNSKSSLQSFSTNSSDEEDFTSSSEDYKNKKMQLIKQIKSLERDIKEKNDKLDKLKRAESYKKVHNVEELQNLTGVWKVGLETAFNDLYYLLQQTDSNFNKDKDSFLMSINIPEGIRNKLNLL